MSRAFLVALVAMGGFVSVQGGFARSTAPEPSPAIVQSPAPQSTFRAGVDLVQVDVSVLDKNRRPVRGLTSADFRVLDDGKPREIVAFSEVDLPERSTGTIAPWTREIAPDVATNTLPEEGRLVVILMDRSIADGQATVSARNIAKAAVRELGAGDLGAVVFSGSGTPQNFTNDHARLNAAIDRAYPAGELSAEAQNLVDNLTNDLYADMQRLPPSMMAALNFSSECLCGACVLDAIAHVADAVRDVPRRRKVLLFVGTDLQVETTESICLDPVHRARDAMFKALDLANLTVHSLDPGGLDTLASVASLQRYNYRGRANLVRQGNISVLPDRTGGRTVLNTNNPELRVADIVRESDSYYLLGFEPAVTDGRRHDISVKVDRRGLDVRTRHAYVANPPSAPAAATSSVSARDAINRIMPVHDGIDISANAMPLEVPGTRAPVIAVALHVRHDLTAAAPAAAPGAESIEVVTAVLNMEGQPVGALRQTLTVKPQAVGTGLAYDVLQRIPAKPGRYELRIGLHNTSRRQTGSVYTFVTVPDYKKVSFTLSDIGVYAPIGTTAMHEGLADVLPAPSTARREFDRHERAAAFLRIYEGASGPLVPVALTARIVDESDRRIFDQQTSVAVADFSANRIADYEVDLPLPELAPGSYLFSVEGRTSSSSARRDLRFSVK
jgi:VWFA-related protein